MVADALVDEPLADPDDEEAVVLVEEPVEGPLESTITTIPLLSLYCRMTVSFATVEEYSVI